MLHNQFETDKCVSKAGELHINIALKFGKHFAGTENRDSLSQNVSVLKLAQTFPNSLKAQGKFISVDLLSTSVLINWTK